jgi:gluconate 2-dehydrogenase gamma chain
MRRRQALMWLGSAGGATWGWLTGCKDRQETEDRRSRPARGQAPKAPPKKTSREQVFGPAERAILTAVLSRLIPSDAPPGFPGATETGVLTYMERQLRSPQFRGMARFILKGTRYLDRVAHKTHKKAFVDLPGSDQDRLLEKFQTGRVAGLRYPTAKYFALVLNFALEGHYGHPRHGGNRDRQTWAALGIDPKCPHGSKEHHD